MNIEGHGFVEDVCGGAWLLHNPQRNGNRTFIYTVKIMGGWTCNIEENKKNVNKIFVRNSCW